MKGRRLADSLYGELPLELDEIQSGDYWKVVDADGVSLSARAHCNGANPESKVHGNLTDTVWRFMAPNGRTIGLLTIHTVREEDDGTISIRPGDGSSNSVLHRAGRPEEWHGYVEHGEWTAC